jgi:hypothetical protein
MALLGAFVYTAFQDAVAAKALAAVAGVKRKRGMPPPVVGGLDEWMCVLMYSEFISLSLYVSYSIGSRTDHILLATHQKRRPLTFTAALAGLIAMGGARYGQDKPLVPEALLASKAQGPALLTLALGAYTVLALHAVTDAKGGLTLGLNLVGAVTIVGALSFYGTKGKRQPAMAT